MPTVKADCLQRFVCDIFRACGVPADDARLVADHLVDSEASGVTSHGLQRVSQYVAALRAGQARPAATLSVVSRTPATAVLDGQQGLGPIMAQRAVEFAIDQASEAGVSAVTLRNCTHTGRLGSYTEYATRRGMAAIMMVNAGGAGQWVAPFGGAAGRLSTNPISIAVPGENFPLVLDIATSGVPEGRMRALLTEGKQAPQGVLIDNQGKPSTDPATLYADPRGALLSFGGHKGSGLSVLIDALAGGLSGAGCCKDTGAGLGGTSDGVFLLVLDVSAFQSSANFMEQVQSLAAHLKSCPAAPGSTEVLVPGELERRMREQRLKEGIPVPDRIWADVQNTAKELGILEYEVSDANCAVR